MAVLVERLEAPTSGWLWVGRRCLKHCIEATRHSSSRALALRDRVGLRKGTNTEVVASEPMDRTAVGKWQSRPAAL